MGPAQASSHVLVQVPAASLPPSSLLWPGRAAEHSPGSNTVPIWETWKQLLALTGPAPAIDAIWEMNPWMDGLSVYLSFSLCNSIEKKNF